MLIGLKSDGILPPRLLEELAQMFSADGKPSIDRTMLATKADEVTNLAKMTFRQMP
jgi:hypothetical protein